MPPKQTLLPVGATVVPIIIYSDKTTVTNDMRTSDWPISLTIGNIHRKLRRDAHGHCYMGSFPQEITNKKNRAYVKEARVRMEIWHECMEEIVKSLKAACRE